MKFNVTTETKWYQFYEVEANSQEEAKRIVEQGETEKYVTIDGEFDFASETIVSCEEKTDEPT